MPPCFSWGIADFPYFNNLLLTEMGSYFCFIGSQYRVEVNDKEYFIDLLLYHRKLKCLVALDLNICEFIPEFARKMQFYLSILDEKTKLEHENASIGIIICKSKDKTIVEYALKEAKRPIGVSTYKITSSLPKDISPYLPSKEEISKRIDDLKK